MIFFFFFNSSTTKSHHFQKESIPLSSQEGENQTSSNFSSSYILKCLLYYPPHRIPVCSLEISLTRRVSCDCSYSQCMGKTTVDYADSPVLSSFSWSCSQFMWWQMLSTKMDSHSKDLWTFFIALWQWKASGRQVISAGEKIPGLIWQTSVASDVLFFWYEKKSPN